MNPRFESDRAEMVIAIVDLALPLCSANPALLPALDAHTESAMASLGARDSVAGRASAEIAAALKGEAPRSMSWPTHWR